MNTAGQGGTVEPTRELIKATLVSWERLRLGFNLILLTEGLYLSNHLIASFGGFWPWAFWILVFGLTTNAWFSVAPLFEIYLIVFRGKSLGSTRKFLFGFLLLAGMLLVLFLTIMTTLGSRGIFNE